jgi:20S proteasome subunit alpha 5
VCVPEGVVLAVEKRVPSPLADPTSIEKIALVDDHVSCAMSGLVADARTLVDHARVEAQNHRFSYNEPMPVRVLTQAVCDHALRFGHGGKNSMARPYGVALLIAGIDDGVPSLFHTDPSGTFAACKCRAIGAGSDGAQQSLDDSYDTAGTLDEALMLALRSLRQVMEHRLSPTNIEVALVLPHPEKAQHTRRLTEAELSEKIAAL